MSTTLLVASAGGHLAELHRLRGRLGCGDTRTIWLTTEHPHSRSLLVEEQAYFLPNAPSRDWFAAVRNARLAREILSETCPDWIISNGASVAVSVLPQAAHMGIRCSYIENCVRVTGPSMSGRILEWFPRIETYTQYASWQSVRWRLTGSVLDEWEAVVRPNPVAISRYVVTVGTEAWPFRRLVESLIACVPVTAEGLWQTGSTPVSDLGVGGVRFLPAIELEQAISASDVVIAHSAIGSAIAAFERGKMPVLVPRRSRRGEAVDDHQVEIGRELARRRLAVFCEVEDLRVEHFALAASYLVRRCPDLPTLQLSE